MQNDLPSRLGKRSVQSNAGARPTKQASNEVDEKKLEAEFGPPPTTEPASASIKRPAHKRLWKRLAGLSTIRKVVYGLLLLLIICTVWLVLALRQPEPVVPSFPVYRAPTPTTVPSKLTGLQVEPEINERQVTGVMIENSVFARPQSSLNQAGVVYEAVAEAGITRFLALFQDTQSNYIGPVRSARPYYVQWCQAFDCALAHVGGSPEALRNIKNWKVKDLDQFFGANYFYRINSRYAPHNVYTSQKKLNQYQKDRGYKTSKYTGFEHLLKEPVIKSTDVNTTSISFNYPGTTYDVRYKYDAKANHYERFLAGERHMSVDGKGKKRQNAPKVVIALIVPYGHKSDGYHSDYDSVGKGSMYVFQNGTAIKGVWSRTDRSSNFVFKDPAGKTIQLTPGQTWISVLSQKSDVIYK